MEIGRLALVNYGADAGKLVAIVDVVDQARALVDGPTSGVARQTMPFKRLSMTPVAISIGRSCGTSALAAALEEADDEGTTPVAQVAQTSWAKKLARKAKQSAQTDFDRFKVMKLRQQRSRIIQKKLSALKRK